MSEDVKHYNQTPIRNAEFIMPPNIMKAKVGSGGLSEQILDRAQALLENHTIDFTPLAEMYLERMKHGIDEGRKLKDNSNSEATIAQILIPCVQLKANGTMFHYPLVTRIADRFVQFMEVVARLDEESLDIADAFHSTIRVVIAGKIKSDGGEQGNALVQELNNACQRYFEKYQDELDQIQNS